MSIWASGAKKMNLNQKKLREFVKSQRPIEAKKPPKLNNLFNQYSIAS